MIRSEGLKRTHRPTRRVAFIVLALILSVVAIELVLRVALTVHAAESQVRCANENEDARRLLLAYRVLLRPDTEIPSSHWMHDRGRGHRLAPGLEGPSPYGGELSSNSIGARGLREYDTPKPEGVTRIVALGDSFTFGEGVGDEHTWPAQLEGMLADVEVVNLGGSAYAHDQMYMALRDDGLRLEPDIVVLGFVDSDMQRNMQSFFCYEKPRFVTRDGEWTIDNVPVPTLQELRKRRLFRPLVVELPRLAVTALVHRNPAGPSELEVAHHILAEIQALCDDVGARLVLVSIPFLDESMNPPLARPFDQLCARLGCECVDVAPAFLALGRASSRRAVVEHCRLPGDHHYSAAGYAVVADALAEHLLEGP